MINGRDIYDVVAALVPLYVAMILAYGSVRWWKIFTPEQCSGIRSFVSVFAVPLLSFRFIADNNPYTMNYKFLAADSLQKLVVLVALFLWNTCTKWPSINWAITLFSLTTMPNTLIMGIPLLEAMYGNWTSNLMVQIVVFQSVIWNNVLLILFEYRGAMLLMQEQFPQTSGNIVSLRVDSSVSSLNCRDPLEVETEIGENGELHVLVRSMSRNSTSAASVLHKSYSTTTRETYLFPLSKGPSAHFDFGFSRSKSDGHCVSNNTLDSSQTFQNLMFLGSNSNKSQRNNDVGGASAGSSGSIRPVGSTGIVGSSRIVDFLDDSAATLHGVQEMEEGMEGPVMGIQRERSVEEEGNKKLQKPLAGVMIKLILVMVWRNLIRNPNTYASLIGLVWALLCFRWNIEMPEIVKGSIRIISNTGLGMAMFSLGLFMSLQPKIITCGIPRVILAMVIKFLLGPTLIIATSEMMRLKGTLLSVAIVQAALPQGIVPFVFANQYNNHADILSTAVTFGILVALPVTIIYYVVLEMI
ncbi:hypothetical protein VNO78_03400 [Psophocarpus tetragonolobus]|uniref:Auxin efflux carrier component n=1 Tax=Psophocarpus tetragonolobus TaxID=3891 RepID=A0AAN9T265_PSOTE